MSLARAFTTRRAKQSIDIKDSNSAFPQRSNTVSKGHGYSGSIRNKISAPMELTHTTNMLAYNAPDLYPKSATSTSSKASDDESDGHRTSMSSPPTSPDVASVDERTVSAEPNHLSCYFTAPGQKLPASARPEVPKIPQRAPSHTKKASYDNLSRQQSLRQSNQSSANSIATKASSSSLSRSSSTSTAGTSIRSVSSNPHMRTKAQVPAVPAIPAEPTVTAPPPAPVRQPSQRRAEVPSSHPFGKELAQVTELAEDFGVKDRLHAIDEEEQELLRKGLCSFRAEDYLSEVHGLFSTFFVPEQRSTQPVWI